MRKFNALAVLGGASLALAACDSTDDASTDASAESVEIPAEEALEGVDEEPVEDEEAAIEEVEGPPAVTQETAEAAAENAADVAAQAEAAANEALEAAEAAEAAADIELPIDE